LATAPNGKREEILLRHEFIILGVGGGPEVYPQSRNLAVTAKRGREKGTAKTSRNKETSGG